MKLLSTINCTTNGMGIPSSIQLEQMSPQDCANYGFTTEHTLAIVADVDGARFTLPLTVSQAETLATRVKQAIESSSKETYYMSGSCL